MAVIFSKNSGVNDGLWKDTDRALIAVMQDADNQKNKDDELVNALFNVKKSGKFGERVTSLTGFSNFDIVEEGGEAPLDEVQEGYGKLIVHKQFMKKFVCTAEMAEDANLDAMKTASANFIRAYKRSRAEFASRALSAQGASFAYGGNQIDRTTGDGLGCFRRRTRARRAARRPRATYLPMPLAATRGRCTAWPTSGGTLKTTAGRPWGIPSIPS